jgi:hypothetical protein
VSGHRDALPKGFKAGGTKVYAAFPGLRDENHGGICIQPALSSLNCNSSSFLAFIDDGSFPAYLREGDLRIR